MTITLDLQDDVALIAMDDGKANAVSFTFVDEMNALLDRAEAEAKAVVIAGRPGRFSAGFDLKVMQGATPEQVTKLVTSGGSLALRLFRFPKPVVAACTGHALAMGALMLLSCDTRIGVGGDFKIGLNETAIGMGLPNFGFELPKARLHPHHFTRAVIQAHLYDPQGAIEAGYLDQVVAPEALIETALEQAKALAQLPGKAYEANKLGIRKAAIDALEARIV